MSSLYEGVLENSTISSTNRHHWWNRPPSLLYGVSAAIKLLIAKCQSVVFVPYEMTSSMLYQTNWHLAWFTNWHLACHTNFCN